MKRIKKPKIVVTRAVPLSIAKALSNKFSVTLNSTDKPFSDEELKSAFLEADGVL